MADITLVPGAVINGYTLRRQLGVGGNAIAWQARDGLRQTCVLKILKWQMAKGNARERFSREAEVIASLNRSPDPNRQRIVHVSAISPPDSDVIYMVMEWVPGGDLNDKLQRETPSPHEALRFFREILLGMRVAHSRTLKGHAAPVCHRDLKPANILIDAEGNPKITDFGLAGFTHLLDEDEIAEVPGGTLMGVRAGTPIFWPPEQSDNLQNVDSRGDIYALGVILTMLLTGRQPALHLRLFEEEAQADLLEGVNEELRAIIIRACQADRSKRYQNVDAFIAAIDPILAATPATEPAWTPRPGVVRPAASSPTPSPRPVTPDVVPAQAEAPPQQSNDRASDPLYTEMYEPPAPRKWGWWIGGGVVIGLVILAVVFFAWPKGGTETVETPPVVETHVDAPVAPPPDPVPTPVEEVKPTVEAPLATPAPIVVDPKPQTPVKVEAPKPTTDPKPKVGVKPTIKPPPAPSNSPMNGGEDAPVTEAKITIANPPAQAKAGETIEVEVKVMLPQGSTISRAMLYWKGDTGAAGRSRSIPVTDGKAKVSIPVSDDLGTTVRFYVAVWVNDVRKESDKVTVTIIP